MTFLREQNKTDLKTKQRFLLLLSGISKENKTKLEPKMASIKYPW